MTEVRTTLDEDAARLLDAARQAVERYGRERRWNLFIRLSWAHSVTEMTAIADLEAWARERARKCPGVAILVGIHSDTDRLHAHALVYVPRRHADSDTEPWNWPLKCAVTFYQSKWLHGRIWLERYSRKKAARPDGTDGAARYIAKDPGSVMMFGEAPRRYDLALP